MKVLIANDGPCAFYYIRLGLARAFHACGHEVQMWDIKNIPTNDIFDSFEPDLFLGQTYNATRTLCSAIKERPHMKVIMKAGDWGSLADKVDSDLYGVLKANETEKKLMLDLHDETGKPDYVHIHYPQVYVDQTHEYWVQHGIPAYEDLLASDIFEYVNGQKRPEFESDISFIGGYWGYKGQTFNKYLVPLCNDFRYKIKIFGNSHWPVPQYCGYVPDALVKDVLASATICPNLSEPHSQVFGFDIIERPFKLLSNKCFMISDYVEGLNLTFGDKIVMAKTPEEFHEKIEYYVKNPDERLQYIGRGHNEVMSKHTYFHRIRDIFNHLGLSYQASHCEEVYSQIRNKL